PLPDAAEWVVLAQRIAAEAVPREDPPQVRVADEDDAVHVIDFAFHPLGAGPDAADAVELQAGVALLDRELVADVDSGRGVARRVEEYLEPEAVVVRD